MSVGYLGTQKFKIKNSAKLFVVVKYNRNKTVFLNFLHKHICLFIQCISYGNNCHLPMHFLVLSSGKPQYIYQLLMVVRVWRRNMRGKLYGEWPSCPLINLIHRLWLVGGIPQVWHPPNLEVETQQTFWKLQTGTKNSCLLSLLLNPDSYVSRDSTISPWWLLCQLVDSRSLRLLLYKAFIVIDMPQLQTLRQATCRDTGNHKELITRATVYWATVMASVAFVAWAGPSSGLSLLLVAPLWDCGIGSRQLVM